MKDLKDYFTPPKDNETKILDESDELVSKENKNAFVQKQFECSSDNIITTKKRRRKKNSFNESEKDKGIADNSSTSEKKRKKIDENIPKKPRISTLSENINMAQKNDTLKEVQKKKGRESVDSSKENSINSSFEGDDKPEASNNLHNYFNKVNKLDEPLKTNILKVEAIVHYPPSEEKLEQRARIISRFRRRKSIDLRLEYDVITPEEDFSSFTSSANNRIDLSASIDTPRKSSTLKFSKTVTSKIKHDGTLNSFFRMSPEVSELAVLEINHEKNSAKQNFLKSGVPESMKKLMLTSKGETLQLEAAPFPKYRHITQADSLSVMWNLEIILLDLKDVPSNSIKLPAWSSVTDIKEQQMKLKHEEVGIIQQKKIVKKLKRELTDYPIGKWFAEIMKMKKCRESEMWSIKYKPTSSFHILGNCKNVEKLKTWLQMLNINNLKKGPTSYGSEEEFLESDNLATEVKNTAVILGPTGSGKTASVYALAEEIGYQILEINSSCGRGGKKIQNEFSEALQSHKVETNIFNFGSMKSRTEESKKSLILIEDVDVILPDYDEGFISTITNLAVSSKRPIIFTINEFHTKHLAKIIQLMHFKLDYELLSKGLLSSWVRTVAAAEGVLLNNESALEIVEWANSDIRKILLQLQFSLVVGTKMIWKDHRLQSNRIWQTMAATSIDCVKGSKNLATLCNLFVVCDVLNKTSNIQLNNDLNNGPWESNPKDSSELNQPLEIINYLTRDLLADTLQVIQKNITSANIIHQTRCESKWVISTIERDVISPNSVLSHSSVAVDYLPALRTIARSETSRLASQSKRNNRYFSYLQSVGITENTLRISKVLSENLNPYL